MNSAASPIPVIVGPTACGKTRKGVALARLTGGEIVSADSRQVYRGMDVGTGKDLADYGTDVPYHLIDIADAGTKYNLFQYLRDCRAAVADIKARGKMPVIVGGTGLYVESFLKGIELPEVPENTALRAELAGRSLEELAAMLAGMKRLHNTTDIDTTQRAIRAIEIETYYAEHPEAASKAKGAERPCAIVAGLDIGRDERRSMISARLRRRLEQEDMTGEVERLLAEGVDPETLIYYGLEYKYLTMYVLGRITRAEMERDLEIAIHQFAKRQMTWWRGMEKRGFPIHWFPYDMPDAEFASAVAELIAAYGRG